MKTFGTQPGYVQLIAERQLCFESVVVAIEAGELLDVFEHRNQQRYPGQRVLVVQLEGYVHLVPYVETAEHFFLKTIIPNRGRQRCMNRTPPSNRCRRATAKPLG